MCISVGPPNIVGFLNRLLVMHAAFYKRIKPKQKKKKKQKKPKKKYVDAVITAYLSPGKLLLR